MRTIDGKYYVLDDAELKSAHQVRREKDSKNVLRCQCPLCSANRKVEHRKEKCVAVYPDDGWGFCYNCIDLPPELQDQRALNASPYRDIILRSWEEEQKIKKNHDYRTKRDNEVTTFSNFAVSKGSKGCRRRYLR